MSMKIPQYLAMTAAQFLSVAEKPPHCAWMGCHFSPWGKDLSNLPASLPPDSILILDDQFPPNGHDPGKIAAQLAKYMDALHCRGLLLDFQRPANQETSDIARKLTTLPFPVCVSDVYAEGLSCPVFVPPCPVNKSIREHLAPWQGREIWLETEYASLCFVITKDGCQVTGHDGSGPFLHRDPDLHTRYRIEITEEKAVFSLYRSREDQQELLREAIALGVTGTVEVYHAI